MLRSVLLSAAFALFLGLTPAPSQGQGSPFTLEARVGAAVPVSAFASGDGVGEGTSTGAVFGVEVTLASGGWRTLYAGFSQARFGCEDAECPAGGDYVATGVNLGARVTLLPGAAVLPWIGVGGITTRVESPGVTGSPRGNSSLGYGGEVSAGLYIGTGGSVALTPAVRFAQARTDLPGGTTLTLRYLVADLGFTLQF